MTIMHKTYELADHHTAMTLCGLHIRTDHAAVHAAKQSGPWVSCPLCEAALLLDSIESPDDEPPPWTQPSFPQSDKW